MQSLRDQLKPLKDTLSRSGSSSVTSSERSLNPMDEFVDCPKCKTRLKRKNLKKHTKRKHSPKKKIRVPQRPQIKPRKRPEEKPSITAKEAKKMKEFLEKNEVIKNKDIKGYLADNPVEEDGGKFGKPQDKYRYGFFGSSSMEYDSWSKN